MSSSPLSLWTALDSLLRGQVSAGDRLRLLRIWLFWQILGAALYGASLGIYSLTSRAEPEVRFLLMNLVKMPLLLLLTAAITCPSLYVFGALRGLRFTAGEFVAILFAAQTILATILGSIAPVMAFFSLTTRTYSFVVLLTVATCALGGGLGLRSFLRSMRQRSSDDDPEPPLDLPATPSPAPGDSDAGATPPALTIPRPSRAHPSLWQVLGWWIVLYMFVGAQMGWILRPFVGHPRLEWWWYRPKESSFVESVIEHLGSLFGG